MPESRYSAQEMNDEISALSFDEQENLHGNSQNFEGNLAWVEWSHEPHFNQNDPAKVPETDSPQLSNWMHFLHS